MSEPIHCPSCNASVRVPDHLLGTKVRCPKCQSAFTAAAPDSPELEDDAAEPRRPRREIDEPEEDFEEAPYEEAPDEEERPRKRRRRKRRGRRFREAEAAVTAPAICLMVLGGVNAALFLVDLGFRFLNASFFAAASPNQFGSYGQGHMVGLIGGGCWDAVGLLLGAAVVYSGYKMKQLENHGLAMAASIFVMVPCCSCCLIGIPLGIWSIMVLTKPEVKDVFT